MKRAILLTILLSSAGVLAAPGVLPGAAPTLGTSGGRFTVDGAPKFLLFVSYFDAMRLYAASRDGLRADLELFKDDKIDGIRIFANWTHWSDSCDTAPSDDGVLTNRECPDGSECSLNPVGYSRLLGVLDEASAKKLLVDVTFTRDTLPRTSGGQPLSLISYRRQIAKVAMLLRNRYPNVFFDLQNEILTLPSDPTGLVASVQDLTYAVRDADPSRLLTVSTGSGASRSFDDFTVAGRLVAETTRPRPAPPGLNFAAVHPPRDTAGNKDDWTWFTEATMSDALEKVRTAMQAGGGPARPVLLQEPEPFSSYEHCPKYFDDSPRRMISAATAARKLGAAGFTFHTRLTFGLEEESYSGKLRKPQHAPERSTLAALAHAIADAR